MEGWDKVVPQFLREMLSSLDPKARDAVEELRLREGFPLAVVQAGEEWTHPAWRGRPLTEEALRRVLETAGRGSVHTVLDQLRSGYVTAAGGVRVGICGEGATREGELLSFRRITSLALRVPHALPGVARPLLPQLAERFGDDILRADGTLDRRLLADRAFATPEGKRALDALTHPEILRRIRAAKQAAQEAGNRLFVLDGAVIVGTEAEAECDRLAVVTAPFATSVARIAARDGISPEMAARRLNAQTPEETLRAHADYVLCNDGALEALEASANTLCEQLLAEAAGKDGVARPF